jgi:hypothetical protein
VIFVYELIIGATRASEGGQKCKRSAKSSLTLPRRFLAAGQRLRARFFSLFTANTSKKSPFFAVPTIRVQAIVGTGGHFLIRLGSQNEWDGQRDRGPEDGTIVKGL